MREVDHDLSTAQPQRLTKALARNASLLVTMGCGEKCPMFQVHIVTTGRSLTRKVVRLKRCDAFATTSSPASPSW